MNKPNEFISWKFPWGAVTCVKSTMKKKKKKSQKFHEKFIQSETIDSFKTQEFCDVGN